MTDSLEDRIVRQLAEERGIRAEKIRPNSRLMQDLGMHGDDAVEFFEAFGASFDVELDDLYENWDSYFAPEAGGESRPGLLAGLLSAIAVTGIVTVVGHVLAAPDWPVITAGLALWFVLWFLWPFDRKFAPITVDDLVSAAQAGKWEKPAPDRPDARR